MILSSFLMNCYTFYWSLDSITIPKVKRELIGEQSVIIHRIVVSSLYRSKYHSFHQIEARFQSLLNNIQACHYDCRFSWVDWSKYKMICFQWSRSFQCYIFIISRFLQFLMGSIDSFIVSLQVLMLEIIQTIYNCKWFLLIFLVIFKWITKTFMRNDDKQQVFLTTAKNTAWGTSFWKWGKISKNRPKQAKLELEIEDFLALFSHFWPIKLQIIPKDCPEPKKLKIE